ncbi:YheC/YheD family protein [Priestia megaterium]
MGEKLVKGTTINGEGLFPFPAVIYDRYFIDGRKNILIDEVRAKLQAIYKIPFVNSSNLFQLTGDKWATYELLMKEYEEFLPESRLVQSSADIAEMLDSYGEVYLNRLAEP